MSTMGRFGESVNFRPLSTGQTLVKRDSYQILDIEIDRGIETCGTGLCNTQEKEIQLFKYSEIPDFLQGNPFVVKGYRAFLPFSLCLKSLFVWNNETINIWSHLMGFMVFFFLMFYDNIIVLPILKTSYTDHIIVTLGLCCYQFCMLCSTGFHMFACHSERASKRWLAIDLTGISIGVIGCYLPAVHYAFYCLSIWRDIYLFIITCLSISTFVIMQNPRYFSNEWSNKRIMVYVGLGAYGVIPTIHWIYLNGGVSAAVVQLFVPKVIIMYSLAVMALVFYITKFPERFVPGLFDFVGSSHQWWHVIVVAAFTFWHYAGQDILLYRINHPCH
ncbi:progestin and adipoQ receptor family member 3-like [Argopecten irradians]|uniref:progestin and adipoQ receptor family member 3-like n=1 Tax=Argopecten irradians TaxID=31199 RepID=UPI00371437E4